MLWLVYILLLGFFLIETYSKPSWKGVWVTFFVVAILSILAGGRWNYGVDYNDYIEIYNSVPKIYDFFNNGALDNIHGELGFLFLCSILKTIGFDYFSIFLLMAFLSVSLNIYAFRKIGWGFFAAVLIYFSHNYLLKEMGQIRNGLSSALLLLSFYSLQKKQTLKFFAIIFASSLIHQASLIFILAYFVPKISFRVLLGALFFSLMLGALNWVDFSISHVVEYLPDKVIYYINSEYFENIGLTNPQTLKQVFLCILLYYYLRVLAKNEYVITTSQYFIFQNLIKIYMVSIFFLFLFVEFDIVARRFASYFANIEPIMIAQILYLLKVNKRKSYIAFSLLVAFYATVSIVYNLSYRGGFDGVYSNWLFP